LFRTYIVKLNRLVVVVMEEDYFAEASIPEYKSDIPILGLGEYREDQGEDDFSRKQTWFYVYGDDEIEEEFFKELKNIVNSRFVDDELNWDFMTLYPTHVKGEVNPNMENLLKQVASETGINYNQVLERNKTIRENHELDSKRAKVVNLAESVDVKDFNGENVILFDNLALTGTSVVHGANKLIEEGAENVFVIVLGIGEEMPGKKLTEREKKASTLMNKGEE